MAQQAVHSALLGKGRGTPCQLLAGKIPAKYRDRQKNVSPLWRRYEAFLSPHGFYFRIWRRGERLAQAQHGMKLTVVPDSHRR